MSEKIPSPDESAAPRNRSWLPVAAVVAAVAAVLAVAVFVTYLVLQSQSSQQAASRRDMVETALSGIEAVIAGDAATLASLSDAEMQKQITPEFVEKLNTSGLEATFSEPKWNGENFVVAVTTNRGDGILLGGPVPDGKPVVLFRTMGHVGATTGGVTLASVGSRWVITEFAAGRSEPSTASVSPTGTPSPTATPPATATPSPTAAP